jgi:precorrin-4 methylase
MVGKFLSEEGELSRLYSADFSHAYRERSAT